MPTYELPTGINQTGGLVSALQYLTDQIPFLMPAMLFFIFIVLALGGYYNQERRTGRGNIMQWVTISSFVTTTGAIILYLIPGIIDLESVIIAISLTLLFMIGFLVGNKE